jgi:hypothetical protein
MSATNSQMDPATLRPGQVMGGAPPGAGPLESGAPGSPGPDGAAAGKEAPLPTTYLRRSKVKQGDKIAGWVTLRRAKEPKVEVHSTDMLDEVNIPINGTVFRF